MATTPNSNPNQLNEKELKRLIELLQKIDKLSEVAAINMANQAQSAGNARQQLDRLEGEWSDITGDISYASKGFSAILQDIKNSNEGLNESVKAYRGLKSIAETLQRYQQDISEVSEKDVAKQKQKLENEKTRLVTANELLADKKKEGETSRTSLASDKARNEQEQKHLVSVIVNLQNKAQKTKQEYYDLFKARKELQSTNNEYVSINKKIENNEKSLTKIEDTLKQNEASIGKFDALAEGVELTLQRISKEVRFKNVENLDKQFKNIIEEAQSTDENLSKITKSFTSISSIAQKVQDHQSGANELSEKDAKKLLEKLESERRRLSNSYELLKSEEKRLKLSKESNQKTLDSTKQEIDILETKSSLTKDEEEKLKTFKVQYQKLLESHDKINEDLEVNKVTQEKIYGYITKQNKTYDTTVNNLNKIKKEQENIRKSLGLSGLAVDGIGKAFNKLGLGGLANAMGLDDAKEKMKEVANEITQGGKKAAGLGGQFRILVAGLKEVGVNILKNLTDPVTIVTGLVAGLVAGVKGLISLFEETAKYNADIAKTFGLSASESAKIGDNLRAAAGSDFFMTNKEAREAFDAMANATGTINSNFSDKKTVQNMQRLMVFAGYSAESAGEFYKLGQLNNKSADKMVTSLQGQLKVLQVNNKLRINEKQAVEMVAKASATVRMNLSANPKALATAAFYASKLGMSLDEIASAAEQTLNFESSIQNQLEYQVLTGKEINIDAYQQAAASGDTAKAAEEMNRILEEQGDSIKGNFFAQEALAKTLGISREQMMKSLELQKIQKKVGGDIAQIEQAISEKMKDGLTFEQAAAAVSEKDYETMVKRNESAEMFTRTIGEIKEAFQNALANSKGFKDLFSEENVKKYVDFITNTLIPKAEELGKMAGDVLEYLTDEEKLKKLTDKFNEIKNTISEVAKIAATVGVVIGSIKLAQGIKNLIMGQPGSRNNPLYVRMEGGGGMPGMDMFGSESPGKSGKSRSKWKRRAGQALKVAGVAAGAYMAYNAFSGKSEDEFSQEEVDAYRAQQPSAYSEEISTLEAKGDKRTQEETKKLAELKAQSDKEAREQLASQQYITGSKMGDIGLSAVDIASTASIPTGGISYSPQPTTTPGTDLKSRAQQITEMKAKTPGLTSEDALKQIRDSEKGWFTKLWDNITTGVKDMGSKLADGAKNIGTKLVDGAKGVYDSAKNIGSQLLEGSKNLVNQVGTKIGEFGTKLIDGAKTLASDAGKAIANMASKAGSLLSDLASKAGNLVKTAIDGVTSTAAKVINAGKNVAATVVDKGKDAVKSATSTGKSFFGKAMDLGSEIIGKGKNAVSNVAGKVMDVGKSVVSKATGVVGEAYQGVKSAAGKAVDVGANVVNKAVDVGKSVATKTANVAGDVYKGAKNIGKEAWRGVTNVADWVKDIFKTNIGKAIGKAFGPILDTVMGIVNINSLISDAKSRKAAGEQVDTSQLGKQITKSGAYSIAKILLNFGGPIGTALDLTDTALSFLGISPIQFLTDNIVDLFPDDAFKGLGDLALGE
jgi:phage-related protein